MRNLTIGLIAVCGLCAVAGAQVQLDLRAQVDLSSVHNSGGTNFIGNNPSAVAWNGTDAWVAGYNQTGASAAVGIVRISNVLTGASIGNRFGLTTTPSSRGFTGLDIRGGDLAAAVDTGAGSADSVALYNTGTETRTWRIGDVAPAANDVTRRGNGVAFDPGFNGGGTNQGVAYLSIGSGRRHLLNATNGAYINGQNAGGIINFAAASTTWRDVDFNPATGDLYARESNRLGRILRSADNGFAGPMVAVGGLTQAIPVDNQNLAFVNSSAFGDFIILNDRTTVSAGQLFSNNVKVFTPSGTPLTLSFPAGFTPATGNGAYDFSFDAGTQTLAVTDFANRQLYIFAVPSPSAAALLGLGGLVAARRRRTK
jgi:hypothetical protein